MDFHNFCHAFLNFMLSIYAQTELSFDVCLFLLLGGPLNVIGVLKFEVSIKGRSS